MGDLNIALPEEDTVDDGYVNDEASAGHPNYLEVLAGLAAMLG
jgi:hypothetical protein